jgi:hypothetical protein
VTSLFPRVGDDRAIALSAAGVWQALATSLAVDVDDHRRAA